MIPLNNLSLSWLTGVEHNRIGIAELEAQGGASGELGTLGMSVMNMLYRLFQEEIVQGAAAVAVGVKGATVAEDLIKTLQTFRTTTTTTRTTTSSCPAATETNIQRVSPILPPALFLLSLLFRRRHG